MAMLDTTVLIDLRRRPGSPHYVRADAATRRAIDRGEPLCTSRINEAEFRVGGLRSADPAGEQAGIDSLLSTLVMLEFDTAAARRYAEARAYQLDIGRPAGQADVFVAAVALANGQTLITRNPKHFADVPGLTVESY